MRNRMIKIEHQHLCGGTKRTCFQYLHFTSYATQRRNFGGHRIDQRIISLHCDLIDAAGRDDTLMVA